MPPACRLPEEFDRLRADKYAKGRAHRRVFCEYSLHPIEYSP